MFYESTHQEFGYRGGGAGKIALDAMKMVDEQIKVDVDEMLSIAETFQKECHALGEQILEHKPDCISQDLTNVWLYKKLGEFEMRLRRLENKNDIINLIK